MSGRSEATVLVRLLAPALLRSSRLHDVRPNRTPSAAAHWAPLARFVDAEAQLARWAAQRPATGFIYEFLRFGVKQARACLFGGAMLVLLLGTYLWYPQNAALARYDFLFLMAVAIQIGMLVFRLETLDEAKVILIYHVVGTVMEVFKTDVGSWIYPGPSIFHIAGVPPASCMRRLAATSPAAGACSISALSAIRRSGRCICLRRRSM